MLSFRDCLSHWAKQQPQQTFIESNGICISFKKLQVFCEEFAAEFSLSANSEKFKLLALGNELEDLLVLAACAYSNIRVALINSRLAELEQLKISNFLKAEYFYKTASNSENCQITAASVKDFYSDLKTNNDSCCRDDFRKYERNLNELIIFSSGSTGTPKAIAHSWSNFFTSAQAVNEFLKFNSENVWGLTLPLCHAAGLAVLCRALIRGSKLLLASNALELEKVASNPQLTHISLVPKQLDSLLSAKTNFSGELKAILLGGSAINKAQIQKYASSKLPVFLSYGLSEAASTVAIADISNGSAKFPPDGQVLPHLKIIPQLSERDNATDKDSLKNTYQELVLEGESLFHGYINEGLHFAKRQIPLATGDLADVNGATNTIRIIGRKDRMFISGGENIYPEEIEAALLEIEGIAAVQVLPVKSKTWGERPVAFIQFANLEKRQSQTKLKELLATRIAKFKIPEHFIISKDLLQRAANNPLGKISPIKKGNT